MHNISAPAEGFDGWQPYHRIYSSLLMPKMQISTLLRFSKAIWPGFPARCSHCISECSALQSKISTHLIRVLNVFKCLKFQELALIFKATSSIFSRPLFCELRKVARWHGHWHTRPGKWFWVQSGIEQGDSKLSDYIYFSVTCPVF